MEFLKKIALDLSTIHLKKNVEVTESGELIIKFKWGEVVIRSKDLITSRARPQLVLYQGRKNVQDRE